MATPAFKDVENDGVWLPGGTYTFKVFYSNTSDENVGTGNFWNVTECTLGATLHAFGQGLVADNDTRYDELCGGFLEQQNPADGNILFDNNDENANGSVANTLLVSFNEDEGDPGWFIGTVTIPEDLASGTYYFKARDFDFNTVVG